jgi:hypothetical protein
MSTEISNELIENRTGYLSAFSIVPQPTTLPRFPLFFGSSRLIVKAKVLENF